MIHDELINAAIGAVLTKTASLLQAAKEQETVSMMISDGFEIAARIMQMKPTGKEAAKDSTCGNLGGIRAEPLP